VNGIGENEEDIKYPGCNVGDPMPKWVPPKGSSDDTSTTSWTFTVIQLQGNSLVSLA
jgi:hypothetical protein